MKQNLLALLLTWPVWLSSQQMTKILVAEENWLFMNPAALPSPLDQSQSGEQLSNYVQCSFNSAYYTSPDDPKHIGIVYLNVPNWAWPKKKSSLPGRSSRGSGFAFGGQCTHTSIAGASESNIAFIGMKHLIAPNRKRLFTLGISLGIRIVSENTDYLDFKQSNDPFDVGNYSAFSPSPGIGMYYFQKRNFPFFMSASVQQISGTWGIDDIKNISMVPHFYLGAGLILNIQKEFKIQPMIWISRAQQISGNRRASSPISADFICRFKLLKKDQVTFDLGYGSANGLRAGFGLKIKNYLRIGFAYDHARANIFGPQTEVTTAGYW